MIKIVYLNKWMFNNLLKKTMITDIFTMEEKLSQITSSDFGCFDCFMISASDQRRPGRPGNHFANTHNWNWDVIKRRHQYRKRDMD